MLAKFENRLEPWVWLAGIYFLIAYSYAYYAPFYLDDFTSIVNNPLVLNAQHLSEFFHSINSRPLSYISFWLDTRFFGSEPADYRTINYLLHIGTSAVLGVLLYTVLRDAPHRKLIAVASAAVFLLHPLNTQAVVYIVQRMSVMAGIFSIISLYCFVKAVEARAVIKFGLIVASCLFFLAAVLSKQNAVVFPIIFYFYYRLFVSDSTDWKFEKYCFPILFLCVVAILGVYYDELDSLTRETQTVSRMDYFLAQGPIIWSYISKFFFPYGLHLEYSVNASTYSVWFSVLAWGAHFSVVAAAIYFGRKAPLISFGVLFYYAAHSVESSFIPISDFAFEHRTYLPNVGLIVMLAGLVQVFSERIKLASKSLIICFIGILTLMTALTAYRNHQWNNQDVFYANELSYNEDSWRVNNKIAQILVDKKQYSEAIDVYNEIFRKFPDKRKTISYLNLLVAYVGLEDWANAEKIEKLLTPAVANSNNAAFTARFYLNRAKRLYAQGRCDGVYSSVQHIQNAFSGEVYSLVYRSLCDIRTGNIDRAQREAKRLMKFNATNPEIIELYEKAFGKGNGKISEL